MIIPLWPYEMAMCEAAGRARYDHAVAKGRDAGLGPTSKRNGPENDIRGARCEYAASIALNLFWRPSVGLIHERDVGGIIDVRSTDYAAGSLIIKPADPDKTAFVLVIADQERARFNVAGWMFAMDAKKLVPLEKRGESDPGHYVKQGALWPLDDLIARVHTKIAAPKFVEAAE